MIIKQRESEWNVMPNFTTIDSLGRELMGEQNKNPLEDSGSYYIMLKYYGLNENTQVVFKDFDY